MKRSPAKLVVILANRGEPSLVLEERGQRHPAAAAHGASRKRPATAKATVEDRAAVTLPHAVMPKVPAFVFVDESAECDVEDLIKKLESLPPIKHAQFLDQHIPPLPEPRRAQPKNPDSHT